MTYAVVSNYLVETVYFSKKDDAEILAWSLWFEFRNSLDFWADCIDTVNQEYLLVLESENDFIFEKN